MTFRGDRCKGPFRNARSFPFQIQTDKEKLLYELDNLQRELEKAQVNTTRFQHEKEDFEVDAGRQREKNEKLQVRN